MAPPLPLYRGQGNQPFKTAQPQSAAKRGQTVPYDVNGAPSPAGGVTSFNTRTGAITLASSDVTTALGFTPYNATNPSGYISSITSSMVTTALGYTPSSVTGLTGVQSVAAFKTGLSLVKGDVGLGSVDNTADTTKNVLSATKLTTARTLAATGDVTWSGSFDGSANFSVAATVVKINGVALSGLATGILKNTTTTGVPSIAVAADFPTLNQNTTGSAATLTTSRNIDGQAFNGSADITVIAPGTHAATSKTTPVDADELPLVDSAASNVLKKLTWANLKATLKTYLDTLYQALNSNLTTIAGLTSTTDNFIVSVGSAWASRTPAQVRTTLGFGGYSTGTSFPGSPSTNDRCYRTDRGIEYYWDGTRWLSTQLLYVSIPNTDFLLPRTATTLGMCRTANPFAALYAIYVVDAVFHNFITATSTWTLAIIDNDASVATTLATRSTSGDAINTHLSNRVTVNAVVASTVDNLQGEATLVSGAASLYCSFGLTYRLIG